MAKAEFNFSNDVVVVCGGSGAIGAAIVEAAVKAGAKVFNLDVKKPFNRGDLTFYYTDLNDIYAVNAAANKVSHCTEGRVHLVLTTHYQPPWSRGKALWELSEEIREKMLRDNISTYVNPVVAFGPLLKERQGNVVVIGSINGHVTEPRNEAYAMCKGLQSQLAVSLALTLGEHGCRVNEVAPGAVDTPGNRQAATEQGGLWVLEGGQLTGKMPLPENVANVALWLLSEQSAFVTGACIPVDGGASKWHTFGAFGRAKRLMEESGVQLATSAPPKHAAVPEEEARKEK